MAKQVGTSNGRKRGLTLQHSVISGAAALAAMAGLAPGAAQAATFTVNNTSDSGPNSLRAAITSANANPDADTVVFAPALSGQTITLSSEIGISYATTIQGLGQSNTTISGNDTNRIFYVSNSATPFDVTISSLTLTNGSASDGGGALYATGVNLTVQDVTVQNSYAYYGGGGLAASVFYDSNAHAAGLPVTLTITNSLIQNNTADNGGGGVFLDNNDSSGSVTHVENSTISGNTCGSYGGGLYLSGGTSDVVNTKVSNNHAEKSGGGIQPYRTDFTISDSEVTGNTAADDGGGIWTGDARLAMSNTTVDGNSAVFNGGGVVLGTNYYFDLSVGGVSIQASTISNNTATRGGGISLYAGEGVGGVSYDTSQGFANAVSAQDMVFTNITVAGNSATDTGGGLYIRNLAYASYSLTIASSTIVGNSASNYGGGAYSARSDNNNITLHNSVFANNTAAGGAPDLYGSFNADFSFITSVSGATLNGANNTTTGADPMLGVLADNGGPTFTMLPATGSPLIDAGDPAFTPPPATDQRGPGYQRVLGSAIDMGAVETGNAGVGPPTGPTASIPVPGLGNGGRGLLAGLLAGLAVLGVRRQRRGGGTA